MPATSHPPGSPSRPTRPRRLLFADDDDWVQESVVPLLEDMGFEVVAVLDGVEALQAFEQARAGGEPFDVAVLDVRMPRRNGTDILARLLEQDPGIRILLSSGFERQDLDQRLFQSGRVGFVGKPADEKQIISELRALEEASERPPVRKVAPARTP